MGDSMPVVYCLIRTKIGKEWEVSKQIAKHKHVTEALPVYGDWDVIVRIEAEMYEVIDKIISDIRKIEDVVETKTFFGP